MNVKPTYRNNGAIGAILDEYEKSIKELKLVIKTISPSDLICAVDDQTKDEDCKSIQTILTHVVAAGYNYVIEIRKWLGEVLEFKNKKFLTTIAAYNLALDEMFIYNENLFKDYPNIKLEECESDKKIKVSWGKEYDVEQIYEHAIVHVLRHRRQIERFKDQFIKIESR